jgi:hypothetical protein
VIDVRWPRQAHALRRAFRAIDRLDFDVELPPAPRFLERLDRRFDRLSEARRIAAVVLGMLLLATGSLYFLGVGSTVLVNRVEAARAARAALEPTPVPTATPPPTPTVPPPTPLPTVPPLPTLASPRGILVPTPVPAPILPPTAPVPRPPPPGEGVQPQRPRIVSTPEAGVQPARPVPTATPARPAAPPTSGAPARLPARPPSGPAIVQPTAPPASKPGAPRLPTATPRPAR